MWGPEELLIGSLATSFELTALTIAEQRGVPIHSIQTDATGHVQSKDGRLRVVLFELDVTLETDAGCEPLAESVHTSRRTGPWSRERSASRFN